MRSPRRTSIYRRLSLYRHKKKLFTIFLQLQGKISLKQDIEELEAKRSRSTEFINELRAAIIEKRDEISKASEKKAKTDARIVDLTATKEEVSGDLAGRQAALAHETALLEKMETTVAEIKGNENKLETEYKRLVEDKRLCEIKVKDEQKKNAKTAKEIEEREGLL